MVYSGMIHLTEQIYVSCCVKVGMEPETSVFVALLIRTVNFCVKVLMSTLTYRFTVCINRMARNKWDLSSNRFGLVEDLWLMILFNIIATM
jgi:hypothetical protein